MNLLIQIAIQLTRTLGIAATVVVLLFLSSSDHFYVECPQEAETVEVEMLVAGRKDEPSDTADSNPDFPTFDLRQTDSFLISHPVVATSERDGMNGVGTYLVI